MWRRAASITVLMLTACVGDRVNSSQIVVMAELDQADGPRSGQHVVEAVRSVLSSSGLERQVDYRDTEEWRWRDAKQPPGLSVTIHRTDGVVKLHLCQDLFGNIGPTPKYQLVKAALTDAMFERVGKANVLIN